MRPKKKVLIVETNEDKLCALRFTLEVRGFDVLAAASAADAIALAEEWHPDVTVLDWPEGWLAADAALRADIPGLVIDLAAASIPSPTLLLADNLSEGVSAVCASVTMAGGYAMGTLIERVKRLVTRKRGPRPRSKAGRKVEDNRSAEKRPDDVAAQKKAVEIEVMMELTRKLGNQDRQQRSIGAA